MVFVFRGGFFFLLLLWFFSLLVSFLFFFLLSNPTNMDIQTKYTLEYWVSELDEIWLSNIKSIHRGKNIQEAIEQSFGHLISDEQRLANATASDFKKLVNSWLSNSKRQSNGTFKKEHPAEAAARNFAERYGSKPVK